MSFRATKLERWKERRRSTFVIFFLQNITVGIEHTIIQCSLLPYLKDEIRTNYFSLFYGLISAASFVFPIAFDISVGRCFYRCRKVRNWSIFINIIYIAGCVIYSLPFSPFLPMFGRLLQGVTFTAKSLIYSEVSRVYTPDDVRKQMLYLFLGNAFGEMIGPLLLNILENVNFNIGSLNIMYGNIPSVVLISITIIKIPLIYCFVHDISYELYFTVYSTKELLEYPEIPYLPLVVTDEDESLNEEYSYISFAGLIENAGIDAILLLAFNFQVGFWDIFFPYTIPFLTESLGFSSLVTNFVFVTIAAGIGVVTLMLYKTKLLTSNLYYSTFTSLPCILAAYLILMYISTAGHYALKYVLLAFYAISYSIYFPTNRTFSTVAFAKLFEPRYQSSVEVIRMLMYRCACTIAALMSGYVYKYISVAFPFYVATIVVYMFALLVRRKFLINAKP